MESSIAKKMEFKHQPVALMWQDEAPPEAMQFKERKWGCIMWLIANAAKGKTSACSRKTFGCFGGGVGMGFGNQYKNFPGGEACFCHFLSTGNDQWDTGRQIAENIRQFMDKDMMDHFMHGERYLKSPESVEKFIESLPITDIPSEFVVFKPLRDVNSESESPRSVIFFGDPDQISALVILANYEGEDNERVIVPYAAGCQTIGIYSYREAASNNPRAVLGLTDISARLYIRKQLGDHLMSFTVPYNLYLKMERNVEGSFLEMKNWQTILDLKRRKHESEKGAADVFSVIHARRSIRQYTNQAVTEETVHRLLNAAMSAPSAGNEQPWQFIVIRDRAVLDKIPDFHPYAHMVKLSPAAILVCGDLSLEKFPGNWIADCAAATQNLLLAAQGLGLGAVWAGVYPEGPRINGFRKLLDLPETVIPLALVPIGYPAQKLAPENRFREDRVHYERW